MLCAYMYFDFLDKAIKDTVSKMPGRKAAKKEPSGDAMEVKKSLQENIKKTKSTGQKSSSKVDNLCPIGHKATILKEGDQIWECMLNQTNIQNNNNKYFLLQLLVDEKGQYSTWFRWGRVGYNGQNSLTEFGKRCLNREIITSFFREPWKALG